MTIVHDLKELQNLIKEGKPIPKNTKIHFENKGLDDKAADVLAEFIKSGVCSQAKGLSIYLNHNNITDEGAKVLIHATQHTNCPKNIHIHLMFNNTTAESFDELVNAYDSKKYQNAVKIDLPSYRTATQLANIYAGLLENGSLSQGSHIDLRLSKMGDQGVKILAKVLDSAPVGLHLNLSGNNITNEGAAILLQTLKNKCPLGLSINLQENQIDAALMKEIDELTKKRKNPSLVLSHTLLAPAENKQQDLLTTIPSSLSLKK